MFSSVVVDDLDILGSRTPPPKANAPLVVDADAVLAPSLPFQCFLISRRGAKKLQRVGGFELRQLARCHPPDFSAYVLLIDNDCLVDIADFELWNARRRT